jgi:hypothetical protein
MRTVLQRSASWLAALLVICAFTLNAKAQYVQTLYEQDFSGGEQWPEGMYDDSWYYWMWSTNGKGGENGSALVNFYYCAWANLYTPSMDASIFTGNDDVVTLEFDVWIEAMYWNYWYGDDYLHVYVNNTKLTTLGTQADYTYDNSSSFSASYNPTTDEGTWKHVSVTIPKSARTSSMQIRFFAEAYYSCGGNAAIDNIKIVGTHYTTYAYDPNQINFGEWSVGDLSNVHFVTLSNPNPNDLDLYNVEIVGSDATAFEIVSQPTYIPAGTPEKPGQAQIALRYLAPVFGVHSAELRFESNVDKNPKGAVVLTGRALAPEISSFGVKSLFTKTRTKLGAYKDTTFTITHSGKFGKLVISPASAIEGEYASEYSIVSFPAGTLNPGETGTIVVRHNPTQEGGRHATLRIKSNAGNGDILVQLRGTGIIQRFAIDPPKFNFDSTEMSTTVCQVFRLSNPGSDTLRIKDMYLATKDPDFSLTGLSGGEMWIAPERSRDITICFRPERMGTRVARLRILTDIPMTYETPRRDTSEYWVDIMGTGVPYGQLSFGDFTVDSAIVGQENCHTETIMNTGQYSITVTHATIVGPNATDFTLQNAVFPMTIAAGSSAPITMCAKPGARGLRNASIVAYTTSNDKIDTVQLPLAVFGQIACAEPDAAMLFHDAKVLVGLDQTAEVTVTNCGDIATQYSTSLPQGSMYSVVGGNLSPVVLPGASHTFTVRFAPTARGMQMSTLTIAGEGVQPMAVDLHGIGAGVTASANMMIPNTMVGASNDFTVQITNNGNTDWMTGAPVISDAEYTTAWTGATIAPGATENVTFTFTPSVVGTNGATVTFPNQAPVAEPTFQWTFNGQGVQSSVSPVVAKDGFALEQSYPNPVGNVAKVRFHSPRTAGVTIELYSLTGELVKTVASGMFGYGQNEIEIDASDLASGTYMYVLTSGDVRLVQQMVVAK